MKHIPIYGRLFVDHLHNTLKETCTAKETQMVTTVGVGGSAGGRPVTALRSDGVEDRTPQTF